MPRNKHIRIVALLALVLISVETLLQLTGVFFFFLRPAIKEIDPESIRIMTLGESATDTLVGRGNAWPEQLEKILSGRGYRVQVFNFGKTGSNSSLILSHLDGYLAAARPHFVITMIGVNDHGTLRYSESPLKTIRYLSLLRDKIDSLTSCELHGPRKNLPFGNAELDRWADGTPDEAITQLRKSGIDDRDIAMALARTGGLLFSRFQQERAAGFFEGALKVDPFNNRAVVFLLHRYNQKRDPACRTILQKIEPCASNFADEVQSEVAACLSVLKSPELTGKFLKHGLFLVDSDANLLKENYRRLAERIHAHDAGLLAMQYPTLPVKPLETIFDGAQTKPVAFISNENNFRAAMSSGRYEDFFMDRARGSWGHTTTEGHRLIATQVADAIEPFLRK